MKAVELLIERMLWTTRLIVLLPVVFSMLIAVGLFIITSIETVLLLGFMLGGLDPSLTLEARDALRLTVIAQAVDIVDGYLLASLLIIFALGLYELFINKLDVLERAEFADRVLLIKSFDDLKDRLANVVQVILIVKFFQQAVTLKYESVTDILFLAAGITLIGIALFLTRKKAARTYEVGAGGKDEE